MTNRFEVRMFILLASLWSPSLAAAQADGFSCFFRSAPVTEVALQQSFYEVSDVDVSVSSVTVVERICLADRTQLILDGSFDVVDVGDRTTTSGRIGVGVHQVLSSRSGLGASGKLASTAAVNLSARLGYEDYDLTLQNSSGQSERIRGDRVATSLTGIFVYTVENFSNDDEFPPPFGAVRFEAVASLFDKRAPSTDFPTVLNDRFFVAGARAGVDLFVDHDQFGSKVELGVGYQRYFTDNTTVPDIGSIRIQWRPQANARVEIADAAAISLNYSFGNEFSGWTFSVSKAF